MATLAALADGGVPVELVDAVLASVGACLVFQEVRGLDVFWYHTGFSVANNWEFFGAGADAGRTYHTLNLLGPAMTWSDPGGAT